jgi:hypothetical protein
MGVHGLLLRYLYVLYVDDRTSQETRLLAFTDCYEDNFICYM